MPKSIDTVHNHAVISLHVTICSSYPSMNLQAQVMRLRGYGHGSQPVT